MCPVFLLQISLLSSPSWRRIFGKETKSERRADACACVGRREEGRGGARGNGAWGGGAWGSRGGPASSVTVLTIRMEYFSCKRLPQDAADADDDEETDLKYILKTVTHFFD